MHTPHTHISTCICILVQINSATASPSKASHSLSFDFHGGAGETELEDAPQLSMRLCSESSSASIPDGIKSVLFSGLDSDS